ncbi:MAG TPA: hypothetical protein VGF67_28595 [Ktedonobacteraceae bacterium]|jgi:hypothetical protein
MRNELLDWFAREGLLLHSVRAASDELDDAEVVVQAPVIALSRHSEDFRECLDPVLFGYPEDCLEMMNLDDFHQFVLQWFERAVVAGMGRCFVCNMLLESSGAHPWDAVFVSKDWYCWLLVHFDCKRYLSRDLKGRNPFEVSLRRPEFFDLRLA